MGDPLQSVNRWAGADRDAVGQLRVLTGATAFPLSVSWRVPARHVRVAQAIAGDAIQARPGAQGGEIRAMEAREMMDALVPGDLVLCRVGAPLVGAALALMARGKRVCFRGRNLSKEIVDLAAWAGAEVGTLDAQTVAERLREVQSASWAALVTADLQEDRDSLRSFSETGDLHAALVALLRIRVPRDLRGVEAAVRELFSRHDDTGAVVLSTVHRAKGLEAERVFLYEPQRMPSVYGDPEEERCVLFVALTRSRRALYLVGGVPHDPDVLAALRGVLGVDAAPARVTVATPPAPAPPPTSSVLSPDAVRGLRKHLGLSQENFARALGVSNATVRNWEHGRAVPGGPARVLLALGMRDPAALRTAVGT